ncbi:MAG: tyrosine-type recombinase/integrase [Actinomycetota bacterium]|nr:tyrosine-type recombinase/integrase [Actinomycetota bacterium]
MTSLAPTLQSWFTDHLIGQRGVSPNTVAAYRDCMRLLVCYAHERHGVQPAQLDLAHLDDRTIAGFLDMLEHQRHVGIATRNARLAAIHSLFSYASFRHPEHAELIARVMAMPTKSTLRTSVTYLDEAEVEAILAAPDRRTWSGQRDHAWLLLMITTGIRVGELVNLRRLDVSTKRPAHIVVTGKGRRQRIIPLDKTTAASLVAWMRTNPAPPEVSVFPARGRSGAMSTDAVAQRVALHATNASAQARSLKAKTVTPHALRHTCAMRMLASGLDIITISLWLGHASPAATRHYLHADLGLKQRALERTTPPRTKKGRYSPTDRLLAFLEAL